MKKLIALLVFIHSASSFALTQRVLLQNDLDVYISSYSGSDSSGDGSSGSPWATLQYAHDTVQQTYDLGNKYIVSYHATGGFTSGVAEKGPLVGQRNEHDERWVFSAGSIVSVGNSNAFNAVYGAMFEIRQPDGNLTIRADSSGGVCIAAAAGGFINLIDTITLSNCGYAPLQTSWGGTIIVNNLYTTGDAFTFAFASGGVIQFNPGTTTTFVGNITYAKATVWSFGGGMLGSIGATMQSTASVSGPRFAVEMNGMLSFGASPTYWPGSSAGYASTGGQIN